MSIVDSLRAAFVHSGAVWVLWLLVFLFVAMVVVAAERFLYFRTKSDDVRGLAATLDLHLRAKSLGEALAVIAGNRSVGAAVASAGLRLADRGSQAAERAMRSVIALEQKSLEARLTYLGTLGNNAPFIGLFGTVIGVVGAFQALGEAGAVAGTASSQLASSAVMAAIAEALVATAVGIAAALPAVALYNYFQRRIAALMADADALANLVVAYLVDEQAHASTAEAHDASRSRDGRGANDLGKPHDLRNPW